VDGVVRRVTYPYGTDVDPEVWVSGFHSGDDDPSGMVTCEHIAGQEPFIAVTDLGNGGPAEVWKFYKNEPENEIRIVSEPGTDDLHAMSGIAPYYDYGLLTHAYSDYYGCQFLVYIDMNETITPLFSMVELDEIRGIARLSDLYNQQYLIATPNALYVFEPSIGFTLLVSGLGSVPRQGVTYLADEETILLADQDHQRIYLLDYDGLNVGVDDVPVLPASLTAYPNPANPSVQVEFSLPAAAGASVAVYDLMGRHVATLHDGFLDRGQHRLRWDGATDAGRPAASGVYFVRLTAGGQRQQTSITLVR
jgi:hypothetical protein